MNRAATIALAPLSLVYGAVVKARCVSLSKRNFKTHKVAAPVISVGNITTGGTGKTPLVEWMRRLCGTWTSSLRLDSRLSATQTPAQRVLVSDGKQIVADITQSGDEAMMLAQIICLVVRPWSAMRIAWPARVGRLKT